MLKIEDLIILQLATFPSSFCFFFFLFPFYFQFEGSAMASDPRGWGVVFLVLAALMSLAAAQETWRGCVDNRLNFTSNSVYASNLNSSLSSLSANVDDSGFYNASVGQSPDRATVIALCRGDIQVDRCRSCFEQAASDLLRSCPNQKQGIIQLEHCMLRFSNASILGTIVTSPLVFFYNPNNATDPDTFFRDRGALIDDLRGVAAAGGSQRKVAFGTRNTSNSQTIYAIAQCSPDLFPDDCFSCLSELNRIQADPCRQRIGCRALRPSCYFRYETRSFYNETRLQELMETAAPQGGKKGNSPRTIIIVVSVVLVLLVASCVGVFFIKRRKRQQWEEHETMQDITSADSLQFDFGEIKAATDDFSGANKLGEGGFGGVYRGKVSNGQEIAVKRLSAHSGQGDVEFKNEVLLVAKLQHRNLVKLLGFSIERNERLLVYEFVKNRSLDQFIFDPVKRSDLKWDRRFKIIGGTARGLLYLHEESRLRIVHRDLKAGNVLLDHDMNPKIADFGMARLFTADETQGNTSRIVGTYGYMSPEYAMHGQFSVKSDVFSFGVLVLEIISGQKNNSFRRGENVEDLVTSAWKYWREGKAEEMIDPLLRTDSSNFRDMLRCIHIGLLCVQEHPSDRPPMASVVLMLSSFTISLPLPQEPARHLPGGGYHLNDSLLNGSDSKELESSGSYANSKFSRTSASSKNEVSVSELYPR